MELAEALGLNYVFLSEFIEHRSQAREPQSQGGGVHGNAVLTKLDIVEAECIRHEHHPVAWGVDDHRFSRQEPRTGERVTLGATLETPSGRLVQVYSVHLEVFCGPISRLRQFADVLAHSRGKAEAGIAQQIIGGDLNTMGHGIARLSPYHCTDALRWRTVGQQEAEFWQRNLFEVRDTSEQSKTLNRRLYDAGVRDEALCSVLTNPGFEEVFPLSEPTLDNPRYRVLGFSLMQGKLDWLLHRGSLQVVRSRIGNHDYKASDHKWLAADFQWDGDAVPSASDAFSESDSVAGCSSDGVAASPSFSPVPSAPLLSHGKHRAPASTGRLSTYDKSPS